MRQPDAIDDILMEQSMGRAWRKIKLNSYYEAHANDYFYLDYGSKISDEITAEGRKNLENLMNEKKSFFDMIVDLMTNKAILLEVLEDDFLDYIEDEKMYEFLETTRNRKD